MDIHNLGYDALVLHADRWRASPKIVRAEATVRFADDETTFFQIINSSIDRPFIFDLPRATRHAPGLILAVEVVDRYIPPSFAG